MGSRIFVAGAVFGSLPLYQSLEAAERPPIRVVFSGLSEGGSWDLWIASADGGRIERAFETPDTDERTPVLSPTRMNVAYATSRGDLRLYNLYDRVPETITLPTTGRAAWPTWSSDGGGLLYVNVQMGKGPDEGQIWRYDLQTKKAEKVADEPEVEGWPTAAKDGGLLFTTWTQGQTSHLTMTGPGLDKSSPIWNGSLSLSGATLLPTGDIAVIAGDAKGQMVLVLKRDGKLERQYGVPGASGKPVAYQSGLLLTRIDGGVAGIHLLDLSTGKTRPWIKTLPKGLVQMRDVDFR